MSPHAPHLRRRHRPKTILGSPGAFNTAAIGFQLAEFARRVLAFFANVAQLQSVK
ncbi:MAG: hypothetical protein ACRD51_16445 [Candidatus Acidiferrum sp.]